MEILLLRHGQTKGNLRRAYIGSTDEPLCEEGILAAEACSCCIAREFESGAFAESDLALSVSRAASLLSGSPSSSNYRSSFDCVFSSPLIRATQTAEICFPAHDVLVVSDLREMDFGIFEGRNYQDMEHDPAYRQWVDGMCEDVCPGGEGKSGFIERTCMAFREVVHTAKDMSAERIALVAHGGTLMALLSVFTDSDKSYYDWRAKNCAGYFARICERGDGELLLCDIRKFPS